MAGQSKRQEKQKAALIEIVEEVATQLDINASLIIWDGTTLPLGKNVTSELALRIKDPGVIASLLRWPSLDRIIRYYAHGHIDLEGGTLIDFGEQVAFKKTRSKLKNISKRKMFGKLLPFLTAPGLKNKMSRSFSGDAVGEGRDKVENTAYIAFHYDLSNEFYELFLDKEMIYTCGYFTDWSNSIEQAQFDKLDMICRKLRLKKGDRFLDIGCGWGGLVCHAAEHYGVQAHGISLSVEQLEYARHRIKERGLRGQVEVEFRDYADLGETGPYDKIASIGMYEAIGVSNIENYFRVIRSVLKEDGLFLNHGITRRYKKNKTGFSKRSEQRALQRYIFPGGELDDLGNSIRFLEDVGYEVQDVEGWREHYALTTKHWCERLTANREKAIELVGEQAYRIWIAYLGGVSLSFTRGTARIYQVLCSKSAKGKSGLPPSRDDLYS